MKRLNVVLMAFVCILAFLNCVLINKLVDITRHPTPSPVKEIAEESIENPPELEAQYGFAEDEVYLLAQLLCGSGCIDGDGEYDIDFQTEINYCEVSKVLCVVMNRVRNDDFPDTITDVVMQKGQFSVMPLNAQKTPSDIAIQTVQDWCNAYDRFDGGVQNIPENHLYFIGNGVTNTTSANY